MIHHLIRSQTVHAPLEKVWQFFSNPVNLDAMTPPDLSFRIVGSTAETMFEGQLIEYRIRILPGLWSRWLTEISHVEENQYFVDEQRMGPYKFWYHEHRFIRSAEGVEIIDHVTYDVGFWVFGWIAERLFVRHKLERIFAYRRTIVEQQFR